MGWYMFQPFGLRRSPLCGAIPGRMPASPSATPEITSWQYDDATGLLETKIHADDSNPDISSTVSYTYTADGKRLTRAWQRTDGGSEVTTTYYYNDGTGSAPNTGELRKIGYSDSTPDVEFTYDRVGRHEEIDDAVGTRTFTYKRQKDTHLLLTFCYGFSVIPV